MARNSFLADTLKTFLFSLSQGLSASAGARGRQGTNLGMGAALGAPMQLREMERTRMLQEEERNRLIEEARAATRRGELDDAVRILNTVKGSVAPEVTVNAPVATPSPIGTMDGGTFQPPPQGGGTMGVPTPLQPVGIPGYGPVQPQSAQQMAQQKANEIRQAAQLEAELAPQAPPPPPRPIDPNSPAGVAARIQFEEAQARIAAQNRPPAAPAGPADQIWVIRNGKPTPIAKGSARPGDLPYDPVAARQPDGTPTASPYASERATRTVQSVDELLGQVNNWTTGAGSLLSSIPTSQARNFKAQLDTLKANIAFNELTAMREASKTGGALGQVSNIELGLLQSALGSLDQGLSPEQLKTQLTKIKASVERWQKAVASAQTQPQSGGPPVGTIQGGYIFMGGNPGDPKNWKKQ